MSDMEKRYTADDLYLAFVAGAKWWEYERTHFTMWQSDQERAYEYAEKHVDESVARMKWHRDQAK